MRVTAGMGLPAGLSAVSVSENAPCAARAHSPAVLQKRGPSQAQEELLALGQQEVWLSRLLVPVAWRWLGSLQDGGILMQHKERLLPVPPEGTCQAPAWLSAVSQPLGDISWHTRAGHTLRCLHQGQVGGRPFSCGTPGVQISDLLTVPLPGTRTHTHTTQEKQLQPASVLRSTPWTPRCLPADPGCPRHTALQPAPRAQ